MFFPVLLTLIYIYLIMVNIYLNSLSYCKTYHIIKFYNNFHMIIHHVNARYHHILSLNQNHYKKIFINIK